MILRRLRKTTSSSASKKQGFAIVMALSLLSLVFLLVISLVNLVGIDLSLGDARKEKVLAQAHARMGMMVAIGELQKHLGPDTRVSATADLLDERIERQKKYEDLKYEQAPSNDNIKTLISRNQAIDLDEDDELDIVPFGQRYWTGVWKHRARRKGASDDHRAGKPLPKNLETADAVTATAAIDSEYDPHPAVEVAWLVSGNEGWVKKLGFFQGEILSEYVEVPDSIPMDQRYMVNGGVYGSELNAWQDYKDSLTTLTSVYDHPLNQLPDPEDSDDIVWILKHPLLDDSFDPTAPESWKEHLRGEPVKVRKTKIHSTEQSSNKLVNHGAYAYWVSDDGIKTNLSTVNPLNDRKVSDAYNRPNQDEVDVTVALEPNLGDGSFELTFNETNADAPFRAKKHLGLGVLPSDNELVGDKALKQNKIAAFYHSLTANSYGLLTDVRTGGLKRDLSHAFANELESNVDWDDSLRLSSYDWVNDFLGFIFKDRMRYFKSVPMGPNSKANQWNVTAASQTVDDSQAILSGPLWRTLGYFHNLYTKIQKFHSGPPAIINQSADFLPRSMGDNYVAFKSSDRKEPKGAKPFWKEDGLSSYNKNDAINSKFNYFRTLYSRPGPRIHPIQPVLLEFKYSQIPTLSNGQNLGLAMFPSVSLWNPYNFAIEMDELYVEIPLNNVEISYYDPSELDRWRKWFYFAWDPGATNNTNNGGGKPPLRPPPRPRPPPPGLVGHFGPSGVLGRSGLPGILFRNMFVNSPLPDPVNLPSQNVHSTFESVVKNRGVFRSRNEDSGTYYWHYAPTPETGNDFKRTGKNGQILNFTFRSDPPTTKKILSGKRNLLLKIHNLRLLPGEKGNFTVALQGNSTWTITEPNNSEKQFLQINLAKGIDQHPFVCDTGFQIPAHEHIGVKYHFGDISGIKPAEIEFFNDRAKPYIPDRGPQFESPGGITMYSSQPYFQGTGPLLRSKPWGEKKPIFKLTRNFRNIADDSQVWHYLINAKGELAKTLTHDTEAMAGNGFRLRYKLPGDADKIVFEQFNVRALVQSFQDGSGDNWQVERFIGNKFYKYKEDGGRFRDLTKSIVPKTFTYNLPSFDVLTDEWVSKKVSFLSQEAKIFEFFDLKGTIKVDDSFDDVNVLIPKTTPGGVNEAISNLKDNFGIRRYDPLNLDQKIVPRISSISDAVGFFHDEDHFHGDTMEQNKKVTQATLFELPLSPMLSILQLRHANLSDYSHAPSYILGNSYANTQVARYKTWGRVRSLNRVIHSKYGTILDNKNSEELYTELYRNDPVWSKLRPWTNFINANNMEESYGPTRDPNAEKDHQNTTVDLSYYANRALLDGYFMSGVGKKREGADQQLPTINSDKWGARNINEMNLEAEKVFKKYDKDPHLLQLPYTPYRNTRLLPYYHDGNLRETSYSSKKNEDVNSNASIDKQYRYQTLAADLIVDGAFNINSTSVDAWISQLSSLREIHPPNTSPSAAESKTPFPRFVNYSTIDDWNEIRYLDDDEITLLAHCLVEQIKLRGPFLSYSDFVNRRIQGIGVSRINDPFQEWDNNPESRDSVLGFRGAVQAAIAEAEINQSQFRKQSKNGFDFTGNIGEWPENPLIPHIPKVRYLGPDNLQPFRKPLTMNYLTSEFGLHAISQQQYLRPAYLKHPVPSAPKPGDPEPEIEYFSNSLYGVGPKEEENIFARKAKGGKPLPINIPGTPPFSFKFGYTDYSSSSEFGEAPENLLAVENVATGANKPGWLMQSDVLSPLAPVTNARSDTFTIRVMGEPKATNSQSLQSKAWIEVTVQRIPDYIKPNLDGPHHRPHEPFEDRNFNGYWDNDLTFVEHWLDLNQNGMDEEGVKTTDSVPDLPGVGRTEEESRYADGLPSDIELNVDREEESEETKFSRLGINQRFGRKFKIIKFRWIKEQDV